jgi:phage terminase large subunit-like protein
MNKIYKKGTIVPNPKETMTVPWNQNHGKESYPKGETKLQNETYFLKTKNINPNRSISTTTLCYSLKN